MASRMEDWLRQAEHDLEAAERLVDAGFYDWACFAAQQSAEKALKALYQRHHAEGWGHAVHKLILDLTEKEPEVLSLLGSAQVLDKYYIPARYPNGLPAGAPADAFSQTEAEQAIDHARRIISFCASRCRSPG